MVAWLVVGRHLPSSGEATGLLKDVYELSRSAGRPAVGAAITFTAYLLGILSVAVSQKLVETLSKTLVRVNREGFQTDLLDVTSSYYLTSSSWRSLPLGWSLTIRRSPGVWPSPAGMIMLRRAIELAGHTEAPKKVYAELITDLNLVPSRLLGRDPELYGTYDRKRSEAEFRAGVSFPLLVACCALALETRWLWLLALPVPLMLIRQAVRLQRAATDVLAEAVRSGRVESPALQFLRKAESEGDEASPSQFAVADPKPVPPAPPPSSPLDS